MRMVVTIEDPSLEVVAKQTRYFLEGVVGINQWLMRKRHHRIPPLYSSGVRFRLEPWADDVQWIANCVEVLRQGWADCKMACCYRLAQLREADPAGVYGLELYWREVDLDPLHASLGARREKVDLIHVQIRLPGDDDPIEDPSRFMHQ